MNRELSALSVLSCFIALKAHNLEHDKGNPGAQFYKRRTGSRI
jgi:hypothetical protein